MESRYSQTAYENIRQTEAPNPINKRLYDAMYNYLRQDLGLKESVAQARAQNEISGQLAQAVCEECEHAGLTFPGKRVLDLGAGLGGLSAEVARRGGSVIALEPGAGWRQLAAERIAEKGNALAIGAVGEELPLADNSVDLILSLQVLEHVRNPVQVIQEAFRVLKPGGYLFFSYENYFSFWEPHYRVRWLPLLPKPIGSVYLRLLGRDPQFLNEAVTYTTFISVRRALLRAGFQCRNFELYKLALRSSEKTDAKWKLLKTVAAIHEPAALVLFTVTDYARRSMKTGIWELMRKP